MRDRRDVVACAGAASGARPGWQPVATAEVDDRVRAAAGEHTLPRSVGVIRTSSQAPAAGSPRHQRGNDGVSLWCPEHGTEADTRSN